MASEAIRLGTSVSACVLASTSAISSDPMIRRTAAADPACGALGFDVVWAAEAYGSDSSDRARLAGRHRPQRIDVGSAVMQIPARTPAMTAMTAASLDVLTGGRFRLGLGVSGPQVSEGWHGVRFDKPAGAARGSTSTIVRRRCRDDSDLSTASTTRSLCPTGRARRSN